MLQKSEATETASTERSITAFEEMEPNHVQIEGITSQCKVTLEELAICVGTSIARNKRRSRVVQRIRKFYACGWIVAGVWAWDQGNVLHGIDDGIAGRRQDVHGLVGLTILKWALILLLLIMLARPKALKVVFSRWVREYRPTERAAIRRLLAMDDVRTVPSFIDSLEWTEDNTLQPELRQALGRLLPRLTETEAQELGEERQGILAGWMREWHHPIVGTDNALLLGIMHVMACLGRKSLKMHDYRGTGATLALLPLFKRWASGKNAGKDAVIRQAAIECCDAIEQKLDPARIGEQLLRASEPPIAGPESLLRPAHGTQRTPSQELLRPGNSE